MADPKRAQFRRLLLPLAAALEEATEAAKDHLPPERAEQFMRLAAEARTTYGKPPIDPVKLEAAVLRFGGLAAGAAEFGISEWRAHYILRRHFGLSRAKTEPAATVIRTLVERIGLEQTAKELGDCPPDAVKQWANNRGVSASVRRAAERLAKKHRLRMKRDSP